MSEHKKALDAVIAVSKALDGWDGSPEQAAIKLGEACRIIKEYKPPAPAQARDDEAQIMALSREIAGGMREFISMVRDDEGGVHGWNFETENAAQWIASQLAALRSRQSSTPVDELNIDIYEEVYSLLADMKPQFEEVEAVQAELFKRYSIQRKSAARPSPTDDDATTCIACGQHNTAPGHVCPACGRPYLDHEHVADKLLNAESRPSTQGEDALADERETLEHWDEHDVGTLTNALESAIDAYDAIRARLVSAQSSAQVEEVQRLRKALEKIRDETLGDGFCLPNDRAAQIARAALERKEGK